MRTTPKLLAAACALALLSPGLAVAEPTRPQRERAGMKPRMLAALRETAGKLRAKRRWRDAEQRSYVAYCLERGRTAPALGFNERACRCTLEVLMDVHPSFDAWAKHTAETGGKTDEKTARAVGICLVAFGT